MVCAASLVLAGCDQSPSSKQNQNAQGNVSPPADSAATQLLTDVTGVWSSDSGLITIDYLDNQFRFVVGDEPKQVKLGDIDTANETINLLLTRTSDNKEVIWTLRRKWDEKHTSFNLVLITDDGSHSDLGFVRKITADDKNHLANLYAPVSQNSDVTAAASQLQSSGDSEKLTPAPDAATTPDTSSAPDAATTPDAGATQPDANAEQSTSLPPAEVPTPTTAAGPSFNCQSAKTAAETTVCNNPDLSQLDAQMAASFERAIQTQRSDLVIDQQKYWLAFVRNKCPDPDCLRQEYKKRISQLTNSATSNDSNDTVPSTLAESIVRKFYSALGQGNGSAAANLIVEEKREAGPLSSGQLSTFFTNLAGTFSLGDVHSTGNNQVLASYAYTTKAGRVCNGSADLTIVSENGTPLIEKIQALNGC